MPNDPQPAPTVRDELVDHIADGIYDHRIDFGLYDLEYGDTALAACSSWVAAQIVDFMLGADPLLPLSVLRSRLAAGEMVEQCDMADKYDDVLTPDGPVLWATELLAWIREPPTQENPPS